MNSIPPPSYGYQAVYGISDAVNNIIRGEAPVSGLNSCIRVSRLAERSKLHNAMSSFPTTKRALNEILPAFRLQRLVGLMVLPTAVVHDILSVPYHLAQRGIALFQLRLERKKVEKDVVDEIIDSLCTSLEMVLEMLVRLGLETPESLKRKMQDRGYILLLTMARLLEAFCSRFAPAGTVYLASQKKLLREHCSGIARLHFDQIHRLKEGLILLGLRSTMDLLHASTAIERWLPRFWHALNGYYVEGLIDQPICSLLQRLRTTSDELPLLMLHVPKS